MEEFGIKQFRLEHGYSFQQTLTGPQFQKDNFVIGSTAEEGPLEAIFLGKLAEYENMRANVWIDLNEAHGIYFMGKRRSGKTFTLGCITESLALAQWIKQCQEQQAILLLDTMNVFLRMPDLVEEVFGKKAETTRN